MIPILILLLFVLLYNVANNIFSQILNDITNACAKFFAHFFEWFSWERSWFFLLVLVIPLQLLAQDMMDPFVTSLCQHNVRGVLSGYMFRALVSQSRQVEARE